MAANAAMTFGGYGMLFVLPLAWQSARAAGLQIAMAAGTAVQLACAALAWRTAQTNAPD